MVDSRRQPASLASCGRYAKLGGMGASAQIPSLTYPPPPLHPKAKATRRWTLWLACREQAGQTYYPHMADTSAPDGGGGSACKYRK